VAMFCGRKSLTPPLPRRAGRVRSAKNASSGALSGGASRQTTDPGF
jgi:hypothetical protein